MNDEKSCGAVVYTKVDGTIRYVLAQSLDGFWGLPKGHMEKGETEEQTALREVYEEVHLRVSLLQGFRRTDAYALPGKENVLKQVVFFCAEYDDQEIIAQAEELQSACLATYEEALRLLAFESTKRILREAHDFLSNREKGGQDHENRVPR